MILTNLQRGTLALIILCDQFSRNIHRGTADAFALDSLALSLSLKLINSGDYYKLKGYERVFVLMPFMHVEDLNYQEQGLKLFQELADEYGDSYRSFIKYQQMHLDIIKKYGRFPYRNKILGRESTKEELEYMGPTFGQQSK